MSPRWLDKPAAATHIDAYIHTEGDMTNMRAVGVLSVLLSIALPVAASETGPAAPIREQGGPPAVSEKLSGEAVSSLDIALAALPRLEQRAAIRNLTPDTRVALWRHNITSFINRSRGLTGEQRAFLDEAYDAIKPGLFENRGCDDLCRADRHAYLESYRARAEKLFEINDLYRLFIRLGEEPPWPITPPGAAAARPGGVQGDTIRHCNCNGYFECWFAGEYCISWECMPVMECGWWGSDACSGLCA
jgi:hypothetical protein